MSDDKISRAGSFRRIVSALIDPGVQIDAESLEMISVRLSEIEDRLDYVQGLQEKSESDVSGISTTAAMLLKTMLRLTLQTQILYDKLGLDMQEEIRRAASGESSRDDETGGSGGGMGGMLN